MQFTTASKSEIANACFFNSWSERPLSYKDVEDIVNSSDDPAKEGERFHLSGTNVTFNQFVRETE